ncbi:hypothetical protein [Desulfocurvus sp. DL9XJH121]
MNGSAVSPGIVRALEGARRALDPGIAERERQAVALCASMAALGLSNALRRFSGDAAEAVSLRRRAELLTAELETLENLCGGGGRS